MSWYNGLSLLGILTFIMFAWVLSENRRALRWKPVLAGLILALAIGAFLFSPIGGTVVFRWINGGVLALISAASAGARFLFGPLALPPYEEGSIGFILMFQALPTIVFFSAFIALLYYFGVMSFLVRIFAWVFTRVFRTSGAESLTTASNIFVGVESILTVKPHLAKMTRSELHLVLTAGMATVASNVMALYVSMLQNQFHEIAGHLISASLLSAPAAVVFAKILVPEREQPETLGLHVHPHYEKEDSFIEAIINGSTNGMKLIFGIVALLLAVIGLVELLNLILKSASAALTDGAATFSLEDLMGYIFYPFTIMMGIEPSQAFSAARIVGERIVLTEVASYGHLAQAIGDGTLDKRSAIIVSYALCGFAHFASLAIFAGGITAIVPEKTKEVASVAFRALISANLACLMTGAVAGLFYTGQSVLFS
ncbi:MAG: nucleoside transporter [Leptospiraceae bacterium]|nr:nucleoside transporter [Leptospiraceae bacterium]MCB1303731.1 nucleoside transporter [Leptospiraceae bacterium]